jgi:hypothetical protein
MRTRLAAITFVLAAVAVGGCGGGDDDSAPPISDRSKPPSAEGVRTAVRDYMEALSRGDGKRACRLLDERGRAGLIALLPSDQEKIKCDKAVVRVSKRAVPLDDLRIVGVKLLGKSATANVEVTDPPYSSGVLLTRVGDTWKISYPPGLLEKSSPAPGVPLEQD